MSFRKRVRRPERRRIPNLRPLIVETLENRLVPATFVVNVADDPILGPDECTVEHCTLREAILEANSVANGPTAPDRVHFNIPGAGPHLINIATFEGTLVVSDPVIIDGTTQPGFAGKPLIEINGAQSDDAVIRITAGNSTIRGLVINRFDEVGIELTQNGNNVIEGNFIGTTASGTGRIQGENDVVFSEGIRIDGTDDNLIGGTTGAARNIISGVTTGVSIHNGASNNRVVGNYIGTDFTGTADLGNSTGVLLFSGANGNFIGGTEATERNVISGNVDGVRIEQAATAANIVQGNYIGTDKDGLADLGNRSGVSIKGSPGNSIVGNVISGNGANGQTDTFAVGVKVSEPSATANTITENIIGLDRTGAKPLPNSGSGVAIGFGSALSQDQSAHGTIVTDNVISANLENGMIIEYQSSGTIVRGNFIGTDITGGVIDPDPDTTGDELGNRGYGIRFGSLSAGAHGNTIGGAQTGNGNVISGNQRSGVLIQDSNAGNNEVLGNLIGLSLSGTVELGNKEHGVQVFRAPGNRIGGPAAGAGNVIAANGGAGVSIIQSANTTVQGNRVGLTTAGLAAGNTGTGVSIQDSPDNLVGGSAAGEANVIVDSGSSGVSIIGAPSTGNDIVGNFIGTNAAGAQLGNAQHGVTIFNGASNNVVGGATAGMGNTIAFNGMDGVRVFTGTGNVIRRNSIHGNTGLGIELMRVEGANFVAGVNANDAGDVDDGANGLQNYPTLTFKPDEPGMLNVSLDTNPSTMFAIEVFASPEKDPSGNGEGTQFLGSVTMTTNASGIAMATAPFTVPTDRLITATATNLTTGDTSEFSAALGEANVIDLAPLQLNGTFEFDEQQQVFRATTDVTIGLKPRIGEAFKPLVFVERGANGFVEYNQNTIRMRGIFRAVPRPVFPVIFEGEMTIAVGTAQSATLVDSDLDGGAISRVAGLDLVVSNLVFANPADADTTDAQVEIDGRLSFLHNLFRSAGAVSPIAVPITPLNPLVIKTDGMNDRLELEGLPIPNIKVRAFQTLDIETSDAKFTLRKVGQTDILVLQGKLKISDLDLEVDLTGDNRIEFQSDAMGNLGINFIGTIKIEKVELPPSEVSGRFGFDLAAIEFFLDTTTKEIKAKAEGKLPPRPLTGATDSRKSLIGQIGFFDGALNTLGVGASDLDVLLGSTGFKLTKAFGSIDNLASADPDPVTLGGSFELADIFATKEIMLPESFAEEHGIPATLDLALAKAEVSGTINSTMVGLMGKIELFKYDDEKPGLIEINGNLVANWLDGFLSLTGSVAALPKDTGHFLTGQLSFKIDSSFNITAQGVLTVTFPTEMSWPFKFLAGLQRSENVLVRYFNNDTSSDDFIAVWGSAFGINAIGLRIGFDGSFDVIGARAIRALGAAGDTPGAGASKSFNIEAGSEWIVLGAQWQNANPNVPIKVIDPDGVEYTEAQIADHPDMEIPEGGATDTDKVVLIRNPKAGVWQVMLPDTTGLGECTFVASGDAPMPEVSVDSVVVAPSGLATIGYTAASSHSNATVRFFYDNDQSGFDGVPIDLAGDHTLADEDQDSVLEADGAGTTNWDTRSVRPGQYFVYAVIEDGVNPPVFSNYFSTSVTVPDVNSALIAGEVFLDADADGTLDIGEPGLPGVLVNLYEDTNGDGALGSADLFRATQTTNVSGAFAFQQLAARDYLVEAIDPTGHSLTTTDNPIKVALTTNQSRGGVNFGYERTVTADASIGGVVFNDQDGDGQRGGGETAIAGVTIELLIDADANGVESEVDVLLATITTDAGGAFAFSGLPPRSYLVTVADADNVLTSFVATTTDPRSVFLDESEAVTGIDFGYRAKSALGASIGDTVFDDLNRNGERDGGEPGIAGLAVELYRDVDGDGVLDTSDNLLETQFTGASGGYDFFGLQAGNYVVRVTDPSELLGRRTLTTDDNPIAVALTQNQDFNDADFGFGAPSLARSADAITGRVMQSGDWWAAVSDGTQLVNEFRGNWSTAVTWVDVLVGDFDGDGVQDRVGRVQQTGDWWVARSQGSQFVNDLWGQWAAAVTWVDVQVGDVNADGRDDIVGRWLEGGQWWVAVSNGTTFDTDLFTIWSPDVTWADVRVGDFNADGRDDIVGRWLEGGQWWAGISTGSGFDNQLFTIWSPEVTWADVRVGDFNADNKGDIVGRWLEGGQWWVGLSTGSGFDNQLFAIWSPDVTWTDVRVGDFNADNKDDIIGRWLEGGEWWSGLSTGTAFDTRFMTAWTPDVTWSDIAVADLNRDGRDDIVGRWLQGGEWWAGLSDGTAMATEFFGAWSPAVTWLDVAPGAFSPPGGTLGVSAERSLDLASIPGADDSYRPCERDAARENIGDLSLPLPSVLEDRAIDAVFMERPRRHRAPASDEPDLTLEALFFEWM